MPRVVATVRNCRLSWPPPWRLPRHRRADFVLGQSHRRPGGGEQGRRPADLHARRGRGGLFRNGSLEIDFTERAEVIGRIADVLEAGSRVTVRSPRGTELQM